MSLRGCAGPSGKGHGHLPLPETANLIETDPLLERLLAKDENAFRLLVGRYHRTMISVARSFVGSQATAEEVAQDTWLAVINGLAGFEGRSTLKNWIFGILVNKARTRAGHESRISNFAYIGPDSSSPVDPARFGPDGSWTEPPSPWETLDLSEWSLGASCLRTWQICWRACRQPSARLCCCGTSREWRWMTSVRSSGSAMQTNVFCYTAAAPGSGRALKRSSGHRKAGARLLPEFPREIPPGECNARLPRDTSAVERCRLGLHDECLPLLWYRDGDPVVLTCREVAEMANDYVDHDLPWLPRLQLQVHLALCRHCRTFTQQLVQAIQLLHHIREQSPGPEIEQRLLAAFEEAKDRPPRSRHGTRE
jgi:hypothetical protein